MKKIIVIVLLSIVHITNAQVGIGNTNPTEPLEVTGDVLIGTTLETNSIGFAASTEDDFHIISRLDNSTPVGLVKVLKPDNLGVIPIRYQRYEIINVKKDDVSEIDLGLERAKYIVAISSFKWNGQGLVKDVNNGIGPFTLNIVQKAGNPNWLLSIKNTTINPASNPSNITYDVTLCIYQTSYFADLGTVKAVDFLGGNSGTVPLSPDNTTANGTPFILQ